MAAAERIFRRCGAPQFSTSNFMVFRGRTEGEVSTLSRKREIARLGEIPLACVLRTCNYPVGYAATHADYFPLSRERDPSFLPFYPSDRSDRVSSR